MLDAWSPSSRRSWRTTRPGLRRPQPNGAWKRTSSSRSCPTCSTEATRRCTWPRPGSATTPPVRLLAARHPRRRGQPPWRGGAALRLRPPAAVADVGPGRPTAHHRAAGLAGATVDQPDRGEVTPLHRAVRARSPAAVAAQLSAGADPHAATSKAGSTPLHLAVAPTGASGTAGAGELQLEIVRTLLPPALLGRRGSQRRGRGRPDPEPGAARRPGRRATFITGLADVSRVRHDMVRPNSGPLRGKCNSPEPAFPRFAAGGVVVAWTPRLRVVCAGWLARDRLGGSISGANPLPLPGPVGL